MSVYVIAEAGVNHNGSLELAKMMAFEAKKAGADCVKFQTFISENLVTKEAVKAAYQIENTDNNESQYNMLKSLELSFENFVELKDYCDEIDIDFMSTPFDMDSIEFLDSLDMNMWKIPSGEITNWPYLVRIAQTGKDIIMSTGMSSIEEVKDAVELLKENGCGKLTILHCTTQYPAPYEECNLNAIDTLRKEFNVEVGYSDHTKGIVIPVAAVAKGALVIEKHFTLDRNMDGPDHKASIEPHELKKMVDMIRIVESSLGDGVKKASKSECANKNVVRKSIVAKCDIKEGEMLTETNITTKRPGTGINPMNWKRVIGTKAICDFHQDELIRIN